MDGLEMAYNRPKAEAIITGLEDPINTQLVKLFAFDADDETRRHWKNELQTWVRRIGVIRRKPNQRTADRDFYFRILYDEPFGGVEELNVRSQVRLLSRQYRRNDRPEAEILKELRSLHERLAEALARGEDPEPLIEEL